MATQSHKINYESTESADNKSEENNTLLFIKRIDDLEKLVKKQQEQIAKLEKESRKSKKREEQDKEREKRRRLRKMKKEEKLKKEKEEAARYGTADKQRIGALKREEAKRRKRQEESEQKSVAKRKGYELRFLGTTNMLKSGKSKYDEYQPENIEPPVDIIEMLKEALRRSIEMHDLKPGNKIRIVVDHDDWSKTGNTKKLETIPNENIIDFLIQHSDKALELIEHH